MYPPQIHILKPKHMFVLRGGALGRCLGNEGGVQLNDISALIKETPGLAPSTM